MQRRAWRTATDRCWLAAAQQPRWCPEHHGPMIAAHGQQELPSQPSCYLARAAHTARRLSVNAQSRGADRPRGQGCWAVPAAGRLNSPYSAAGQRRRAARRERLGALNHWQRPSRPPSQLPVAAAAACRSLHNPLTSGHGGLGRVQRVQQRRPAGGRQPAAHGLSPQPAGGADSWPDRRPAGPRCSGWRCAGCVMPC